ncbi:MAG: PTS sugar transporter subunit IIB [Helcococcus sp.]|nr:PTS sugar transporter subunit IIB [Helcococcus sp.]
MAITLARVDDRVIHGQITTRWSKARNLFGFIVVSDKVAADDLRKRVLKAAADNYRIGIYDENVGISKIQQAKESNKSYFVISDSPQNFANILKNGGDFGKVLNIGCMNTRPGAKVMGRTVAIDDKDYEALDYMYNNGIDIQFQLLPSDPIRDWPSVKKQYDSMK